MVGRGDDFPPIFHHKRQKLPIVRLLDEASNLAELGLVVVTHSRHIDSRRTFYNACSVAHKTVYEIPNP